jgi:hypothetical protein
MEQEDVGKLHNRSFSFLLELMVAYRFRNQFCLLAQAYILAGRAPEASIPFVLVT